MNEVVRRAATEESFRAELLDRPDEALEPYSDRLTVQEHMALASVRHEPLALAVLLERVPDETASWWRALVPSSFKELGGAVLSVALIAAFLAVLAVTLGQIGTDPRGVSVGTAIQSVDEFARSKDVLAIVLPLFGAVVTFWLGIAVEAKRGDEHKQSATQARTERDDAQAAERRKATVAAGALGAVEGALASLQGRADTGARGPFERESVPEQQLRDVTALVQEARRRIEG